ncbi:hypothetical protein [Gracilibacillus salinarum]|uniref:Peptidyl-prolyl cis-trans isomerase n=1 Tax=Gracilibacillus salinarum TaxID=2932255 RepID=A0ABY4GML5_9BACI|nr:hypothetical protein [Gracilibacillus salinarum]UOQ85454.1 hypothetical protein MUN87_00670 [Gracilibacillus salinarum]
MIIQIKGKVKYPITLDPSVWIFDDRKVKLENAFSETSEEENKVESGSKLNKPPVNHSVKKYNKKELLAYSYVMPIREFVENAEINESATQVNIITTEDTYTISAETLLASFLLFSIDGKQIKEDGPAHLYYGDGSNQENPVKAIQAIEFI